MPKNAKPRVTRHSPERTHPHRGGPRQRLDEPFYYGQGAADDAEDEDRSSYRRRGEDPRDREAFPAIRDAYSLLDRHYQRGYRMAQRTRGSRRGGRMEDPLEPAFIGIRALSRLLSMWADLLLPMFPPALRDLQKALSRGNLRRRGSLPPHWQDEEYEERDDHSYEHEDDFEQARPRTDRRHKAERDDEEINVSLKILANRPVTVSISLDRDLPPGKLDVGELLCSSKKSHKLTGASLALEDNDRVVVSVAVGDDQAPGTYEGDILAGSRLLVGQLSITVEDTSKKASS